MKLESFRELMNESNSKKLNEVISSKDVENSHLSKKSSTLIADVINGTENHINTYLRWIAFSESQAKDLKTIKSYNKAFKEWMSKFDKLMQSLEEDYKYL